MEKVVQGGRQRDLVIGRRRVLGLMGGTVVAAGMGALPEPAEAVVPGLLVGLIDLAIATDLLDGLWKAVGGVFKGKRFKMGEIAPPSEWFHEATEVADDLVQKFKNVEGTASAGSPILNVGIPRDGGVRRVMMQLPDESENSKHTWVFVEGFDRAYAVTRDWSRWHGAYDTCEFSYASNTTLPQDCGRDGGCRVQVTQQSFRSPGGQLKTLEMTSNMHLSAAMKLYPADARRHAKHHMDPWLGCGCDDDDFAVRDR